MWEYFGCVWVLFRLYSQVLSPIHNVTLVKAKVLNNCTIGMHCMLVIECNDVKGTKASGRNILGFFLFFQVRKKVLLSQSFWELWNNSCLHCKVWLCELQMFNNRYSYCYEFSGNSINVKWKQYIYMYTGLYSNSLNLTEQEKNSENVKLWIPTAKTVQIAPSSGQLWVITQSFMVCCQCATLQLHNKRVR